MRKIAAIALDITTVCNLRCENCCCKVHERKPVHYDWNYFERLAPYVYGIDRIDITGGEPSCHPRFTEYVPKFRKLFGCNRLTVETNAMRAKYQKDTFRHFDEIRLSLYPENKSEIEWTLKNFENAWVQNGSTCIEIGAEPDHRKHVSLDRIGGGGLCKLGKFEFVLFTDGKLWPCRLGPAVPGAVGIEPCEDWRERVLALPIPCGECWFSTGAKDV